MRSKNISHYRTHPAFRFIAFFLTLSFCLNSSGNTPSYAQTLRGGAEDQYPHSLKANRITSDTLAHLALLSDMGKIEEVHSGKDPRTVIIIEDAHANPEAQKSLRKLVEYFQEQYGVSLIALEGASGKLDPLFYRNFPDRKILTQVFEDYLGRGELSGAAVASILNEKEADYYGVEDAILYEKGINAFLQALKNQEKILPKLNQLHDQVEAQKKEIYSSELLELDQKSAAFDESKINLEDYLKYLAHLKTQIDFKK